MSANSTLTAIDLDPSSSFGRRMLKWAAGVTTSMGILFVLAHVQRTEIVEPAPPIQDLRTVVLEEPPPPPPEIATKEPPPPTVLDLEPLPSDNIIKISVAPLTYEIPLPEANPELEISLDAFRPDAVDRDDNPNHVFQFREVDQRPVIIHRKKPDVPYSLLREVKDPRVVVSMVVTRGGGARDISLVQSSGNNSLDKIVVEALSEWRFRPAIRNGATVNCLVIQSIVIKPPRGGSPFTI
ncbi:energy transducer TonB [Synoicihabitans lomoniglobus]|uniref:TonB family protein n=1 Tax=Synoicihabitans lomoniglobus TaxID=2909285 RepID=A0AAE9ZTX5_9BACT|nr:TonB family protein [Opitutaceae bacterium LMO-M01]WED64032.1 TonB family protein [Opitutaceae bacterium LMO-M01]